MKYSPIIGVEIHVQLNTKSKMFCACDNNSVGTEPNINICPICLGYPGTLPTINKRTIDLAIKMALGLNTKPVKDTKFDRKNYFYPDLPKGYQISQYDQPIIAGGYVEILVDGQFKKIGIERAHLEEDAAKLIHPDGTNYSLVDYNRGGTPLLEIVSKPDMISPKEARRFLQEVYNIATTLGVTHGDMEEGNFKFDLNVSVRLESQTEFGTKVELKNLNSFRNAERSLTYEINRQTQLLESGGQVAQETRGWNDTKGATYPQRTKEEADDYRYFPEPDLPPLVITEKMIAAVKKEMPQAMPIDIRQELQSIGLSLDHQDVLISQPNTQAIFFEAYHHHDKYAKPAANWLTGDYQAILNEIGQEKSRLTGQHLIELISLIDQGEISSKIAKDIFPDVVKGKSPKQLIQQKGLSQISDVDKLEAIVKKIIAQNPKAAQDYQAGKAQAIGFLMGQVMKETKGQAEPSKVNQTMVKLLKR